MSAAALGCRAASAMARAFGVRAVRLGTLATAMLVIGSLTPAYLPQNSPWWRPIRALGMDAFAWKVAGTLLVMAGLALLVHAWLRVREHVGTIHPHAVLAWWSLPLLPAPPIFSHDAYSYAAQGWLIHNGLNPYRTGPGALPGPFADQSPWVWRFTPTPYGPLSLHIQHAIVELTHLQPYLAAVMMRVPALVGVILIAVYVPRIADHMGIDRHAASWLGVLNPILITDFVGGAHNDAHMVGLTVLGVWLAYKRRWLWGAAVIGVAATIKQPALLAAFAIAFVHRDPPGNSWRDWWNAGLRALQTCAVALACFAGVSLATGYGFGWLNAVGVPGSVLTISPFTLVGQVVQWGLDAVGVDPSGRMAMTAARSLGLLVAAGLTLWWAVRRAPWQPMTFLAWSYLAIALCGPALHGWYMMWGGVFLPLTRPSPRIRRAAVWASVILLSYAAINLSWRNDNTALGIALTGLACWQVSHFHRHHDSIEGEA